MKSLSTPDFGSLKIEVYRRVVERGKQHPYKVPEEIPSGFDSHLAYQFYVAVASIYNAAGALKMSHEH